MAEPVEPTSIDEKYYFVIRRLHSLTGIVPIGVFLCFHLAANATILVGDGAGFQRSVRVIHLLGPLLVPVELIAIFAPLLFHAILGLWIYLSTSRPNAMAYRYGSNVRYTLQRFTGVIALAFIVYHVWQMHWLGAPFGGGKFDPNDAVRTAVGVFAGDWLVAPIYLIGVVACVYHFVNGVWTALITWGITVRPQSQRVAGYVCAMGGVVLSLVGIGALRGFKTVDPVDTAPKTAEHTTGTMPGP